MNRIIEDFYSPVCHKCVGDSFLKERIKKQGAVDRCHFCSARAKCITVDLLSNWVGEILDTHFEPGFSWPYYDMDSDRVSHYEQKGEELYSIVEGMVEADEPIIDAVINKLSHLSYRDVKDGAEPRYDSETNYDEKSISTYEVEWEWNQFRQELKHRSRFFNAYAKDFLDRVMKDLQSLRSWGADQNSVVRIIKPESTTVYYRARLVNQPDSLSRILEAPSANLGPPPPRIAPAGRMNPEGISVFYGALDQRTCIAELRPSIGSTVVSAEFELIKPIRVLEFQLLGKCYHDQPLSYFQPDFYEKIMYRQFLRKLHAKISQPVLPGNEHEYLITQVLTEYLSTIVNPRIDGVIFSSVQHEKGLNLVLFNHILDIQLNDNQKSVMGENSALKLREESIRLHRITAINYDFDKNNLKDIDIDRFYSSGEYFDDYDS
jgi:hypothetical protein